MNLLEGIEYGNVPILNTNKLGTRSENCQNYITNLSYLWSKWPFWNITSDGPFVWERQHAQTQANVSSSYRPPSVYTGRYKYRYKRVLKITDTNTGKNTEPIHVHCTLYSTSTWNTASPASSSSSRPPSQCNLRRTRLHQPSQLTFDHSSKQFRPGGKPNQRMSIDTVLPYKDI